jgi:hypothetical protein
LAPVFYIRAGYVVVWLALAGAAALPGLQYYLTPLAERPFSVLHDEFGPAGTVGLGYGVVGTGLIIFGVMLYSARRRLKFLASVGKIRHWLGFHIFLCVLGAFLVILHTTFKLGGLVSVSFWSMVIVVVSGVFGRYVYGWIPRSVVGRLRTAESLRDEQTQLLESIAETTHLPEAEVEAILGAPTEVNRRRLGSAFAQSFRFRIERRRERKRLSASLDARGVTKSDRRAVLDLAARRSRLDEQLLLLPSFQRLFRYWHNLHLPLAVVMFVVLAVHVGIAVALGYTWSL